MNMQDGILHCFGQSFALKRSQKESTMARILCFLLFAFVLAVESKPCGDGKCSTSAGCHCLDLSFYDYFGNEHGNCLTRTTDPSGSRWCYVSQWSSCTHKQRSQRYKFYPTIILNNPTINILYSQRFNNVFWSHQPCRDQPSII